MSVEKIESYEYLGGNYTLYAISDKRGNPLIVPSYFLYELALSNCIYEGRSSLKEPKRKSRRISKNTVRTYASSLLKFLNTLQNPNDNFDKVDTCYINAYLNSTLYQEQKLACTTIDKDACAINLFYDFLYSRGIMKKHIHGTFSNNDYAKTELTSLIASLPQEYMSEGEYKKIILAYVPGSNDFYRDRNILALKLGYYAGFRSHELILPFNLSIKKLKNEFPKKLLMHPEAVYMKIQGKGKKYRSSFVQREGVIAITTFLYGKYKDKFKTTLICNLEGDPLTDDQFGSDTFRYSLTKYLASNFTEKNKYEQLLKRSYHSQRKCYCTNSVAICRKQGLDVRTYVPQWLGHSDWETTKIYIFFEAQLNMNDLASEYVGALNKLGKSNWNKWR